MKFFLIALLLSFSVAAGEATAHDDLWIQPGPTYPRVVHSRRPGSYSAWKRSGFQGRRPQTRFRRGVYYSTAFDHVMPRYLRWTY